MHELRNTQDMGLCMCQVPLTVVATHGWGVHVLLGVTSCVVVPNVTNPYKTASCKVLQNAQDEANGRAFFKTLVKIAPKYPSYCGCGLSSGAQFPISSEGCRLCKRSPSPFVIVIPDQNHPDCLPHTAAALPGAHCLIICATFTRYREAPRFLQYPPHTSSTISPLSYRGASDATIMLSGNWHNTTVHCPLQYAYLALDTINVPSCLNNCRFLYADHAQCRFAACALDGPPIGIHLVCFRSAPAAQQLLFCVKSKCTRPISCSCVMCEKSLALAFLAMSWHLCCLWMLWINLELRHCFLLYNHVVAFCMCVVTHVGCARLNCSLQPGSVILFAPNRLATCTTQQRPDPVRREMPWAFLVLLKELCECVCFNAQ